MLEGGGATFGYEVCRHLRAEGVRYQRAADWCGGTGIIGFDLLGLGICAHVDILDVSREALRVAQATIDTAALNDRSACRQISELADLPPSTRYDLIVGNPPHVNGSIPVSDFSRERAANIWSDSGWQIHRSFFEQLGTVLCPRGRYVLIENRRLAAPEIFLGLADAAGLPPPGIVDCVAPWENYYLLDGTLEP